MAAEERNEFRGVDALNGTQAQQMICAELCRTSQMRATQ
jgi:hypothetical protein